MRFSLATLVIAVLWIGAGMWIWKERTPWRFALGEVRAETQRRAIRSWFDNLNGPEKAPDGKRIFHWHSDIHLKKYRFVISDASTEKELFEFRPLGYPVGFLDDNTFAFRFGPWNDEISPDDRCEIYHRRFPEWWWGHFYRPEVWLFIGLSAALVWRFVRWWRKPVASKVVSTS